MDSILPRRHLVGTILGVLLLLMMTIRNALHIPMFTLLFSISCHWTQLIIANRCFEYICSSQSLRREGVLRTFKLSTGQDDHAIMFLDDYFSQVGGLTFTFCKVFHLKTSYIPAVPPPIKRHAILFFAFVLDF